jgi:hypothetical protein
VDQVSVSAFLCSPSVDLVVAASISGLWYSRYRFTSPEARIAGSVKGLKLPLRSTEAKLGLWHVVLQRLCRSSAYWFICRNDLLSVVLRKG